MKSKFDKTFVVFQVWHANTMRGGYGHSSDVHNATYHKSFDEAAKEVINRIADLPNYDYEIAQEIFDEEKNGNKNFSFDTGDYTIIIDNASDVIKWRNFKNTKGVRLEDFVREVNLLW